MNSSKLTSKDSQIEELQAYVRKLEEIISIMPGNIWWKDINGVYEGCNANLAHIYKLNSWKDIIGKTDAELQKDADLVDKTLANDYIVIQNNEESIFTEIGFNVKNQKAYYMTRKKPMLDDKANVIGLIGISVDVTQEREAERLRKENEISEKIIQYLKTIAGSLSHEIRTPLAGLRTGLSLVKSFFDRLIDDITQQVTLEAAEEQRRWICRMIDRVDTGTALINMQLKNMTAERIRQDSFYQDSLTKWIDQALDSFPYENQSFVEKVHTDIDNDFAVVGDPVLTKHMLWNLLNNAFYFIKEEDRGEIFITTEAVDEHYLLRFKDTAKGMSAEEAGRVFDQFYSKRKGGSGLGLHFCQLVMESYGGRIECRTEEGQYTEFLLFFPKEFVPESESTLPETERAAD